MLAATLGDPAAKLSRAASLAGVVELLEAFHLSSPCLDWPAQSSESQEGVNIFFRFFFRLFFRNKLLRLTKCSGQEKREAEASQLFNFLPTGRAVQFVRVGDPIEVVPAIAIEPSGVICAATSAIAILRSLSSESGEAVSFPALILHSRGGSEAITVRIDSEGFPLLVPCEVRLHEGSTRTFDVSPSSCAP